jgi:serine/threonine protein kinase
MAPEQFSNRVSEKVDVYALGVTLWEMYTRQRPWKDLLNDSPWQLVIAVMNDNERLPIPSSCPDGLRSLIEDCWLPDPRKRPAMHEIIERLGEMKERLERRISGRSSSMDDSPVLQDPQLTAFINRITGSCGASPIRKGKSLLRRIGSGSVPRRPLQVASKEDPCRLRNVVREEAEPPKLKQQQQRTVEQGLLDTEERVDGVEYLSSSRLSQSARDLSLHFGPDIVLEAFGRVRALQQHEAPMEGSRSPQVYSSPSVTPGEPSNLQSLERSSSICPVTGLPTTGPLGT